MTTDQDQRLIDRVKCKIIGHVPPEGFKPAFAPLEVTHRLVNTKHAIVLECERCGEEHPFTKSDFDE